MKQKFFTLLLGLAMVSLGAVAQETVSVSISKKYGATTFVCNQDLDFSTVATSMRPYYIEDYGTSTGNFSLKAFTDAKVPANTPMILIGKQYPQAGNSEVVTCDVPVATSIDNAAQVRKDVFTKAGGHAWLMPVINGSYVCSNFNAENAEGTNDEKVYNMTFFSYSAGTSRTVYQTESVNFGQHVEQSIETQEVKHYYQTFNVSTKGLTRANWRAAINAESPKRLYWNTTASEDTSFPDGRWNYGFQVGTKAAGQECVFFSPEVYEEEEIDEGVFESFRLPKIAAIYVLNVTGSGTGYWVYQNTITETAIYNYDQEAGEWIQNTTTSSRIVDNYVNNDNRTVYNYVLSVNSSGNPVFKLCNGTTGTTVPYGKCYVSVWEDVKAVASSREVIGIEFAEDDEDLAKMDDEISGIKNVNVTKEANGIYNINGQKLVKLQKGLNIVNGKKVYVK